MTMTRTETVPPDLDWKPTVQIVPRHFHQDVICIVDSAKENAPALVDNTVIITSAADSHRSGFHPKGEAFDFRVWSSNPKLIGNVIADDAVHAHIIGQAWAGRMASDLGSLYDILCERHIIRIDGVPTPIIHVHGELDPR